MGEKTIKWTREKMYSYWLCKVEGIGDRTANMLVEKLGSAEAVYQMSESAAKQLLKPKQLEHFFESVKNRDPAKEFEEFLNSGIGFLLQGDENYPEKLRNIPDPPFTLFYQGSIPKEELLSVAVIGARECSEYGKFVAQGLGKALGKKRIQVISGMARGIDGISQQAALESGGSSYGVLGCGVDICYPASNRGLYEHLLERGGVLASLPPGEPPRPQNFPPRNRIVSGLADVIIVVEARAKSGTLITVDMALEQGREVYVVPGRITDRLSDGCNRLIKQGAGVLLSPDDLLEELCERGGQLQAKLSAETNADEEAIHGKSIHGKAIHGKVIHGKVLRGEMDRRMLGEDVPEELRHVYEALDFYPQSIEQIMDRLSGKLQLKTMQVNTVLLRLCMMQLAVQLSPGYFSLKV